MEKRNDYNPRTPCRLDQAGDTTCDCDKCKSVKRASADKSIHDVGTLSEMHNEQQHK